MNISAMMATLYVGELHPSVTEMMLAEIFSHAGPIRSIRLSRDTNTGNSLGYAFIEMEHRADMERAVEMFNYELLMEQPMRVMRYIKDYSSVRKNGIGNIIIKNLDMGIDCMALFDTFSVFGTVLSCKVVAYGTGPKGYGYVQFESVEAADLAIKMLNGKLLNNRQVLIEHFKVLEERKAEMDQRSHLFKTKAEMQTELSQKFEQGLILYMKNLDADIDDECLHMVFSRFGAVTHAKVEKDSGRSRGFGFVRFSSSVEAMKAKEEMNGRRWGRKPVYVYVAKRKEQRPANLAHQDTQRKASPQLNTTENICQPVPPPCNVVNTTPEAQNLVTWHARSQMHLSSRLKCK